MPVRLSFAIAGAQKCGTSALDAYLRLHPELDMGREKESHFFDREVGVDWREPDYGPLHAAYGADLTRLRGDATPIVLFWTPALYRILRYNPEMRFVILLRDPVERAFSQWKMSRRNGWEPLTFEKAIREGRLRVLNEGETSLAARRFSYVERGFYARQLTRLASLFGWERLLVLRQDDLSRSPRETLDRVTDFLGVAHEPSVEVRRENVSPASDETMSAADRAYLQALYADDLGQLADMTGIRF